MPPRQSDFAPSPAVESVHRHDSYGARDGYRSPHVLDEDYAAYMRADSRPLNPLTLARAA